jgi:hypothetical protein
MEIKKKSGSKSVNVKVPAPQSPAGVRGIPDRAKGLQNPRHWHIKLPTQKGAK